MISEKEDKIAADRIALNIVTRIYSIWMHLLITVIDVKSECR